jgi:hypothetical protein
VILYLNNLLLWTTLWQRENFFTPSVNMGLGAPQDLS